MAVRPDLSPSVDGKLNPAFVEWLMGGRDFVGWTDVEGVSRQDRLRMLGNAVVPQTAELAFLTLWRRHGL